MDYFLDGNTEACVRGAEDKIKKYYDHLSNMGLMRLWQSMINQFQRGYETGGNVMLAGENGKLRKISVNHFQNLMLHVHVMTTATRPSFDARAINTDWASLSQAALAQGILEYYLRVKRVERNMYESVLNALQFGEGHVLGTWDPSLGDEIGTEPAKYDDNGEPLSDEDRLALPGKPVMAGDMFFTTFTPDAVVRDVGLRDWGARKWIILRHVVNRYDLAGKYPEFRAAIYGVGNLQFNDRDWISVHGHDYVADTDSIVMWELFADKTAGIPDGRHVVWCTQDCVLRDEALPYESIPLWSIMPFQMCGAPFGYSTFYDVLPMQHVLDALKSTVVTNHNSFGQNVILIPDTCDIKTSQIMDGMTAIKFNPAGGKPEIMQRVATPAEIFQEIQSLIRDMETTSGVNSTARGNPEKQLSSGTALAYIQSMAVSFNSNLQASYSQLVEDLGTGIIRIIKQYANAPRVAMIAGKSQRYMLKSFTGESIQKVDRIVCDVANPLSKSMAGRYQLIEPVMARGMIKDVGLYFSYMKTGNWDVLIEPEFKSKMRIAAENEELSQGRTVPVLVTDDHAADIIGHGTVLDDPLVRRNGTVSAVTLAHIDEHIRHLENLPPVLRELMRQPMAGPVGPAPIGMPEQDDPARPAPPKNPETGEPVEMITN